MRGKAEYNDKSLTTTVWNEAEGKITFNHRLHVDIVFKQLSDNRSSNNAASIRSIDDT